MRRAPRPRGGGEINRRVDRMMEREAFEEAGTRKRMGARRLQRSRKGSAKVVSRIVTSRERTLRRLESNERERMRMHDLNDAFQVHI